MAMGRHLITLNPDFGDTLFWDEEENLVGHHNVLYLNYEEPNEIEIDLSSIAGLEKWYSKWCEYEDDFWLRHKNVEKEALAEWCKQGIELSKQIKSLLPNDFDWLFVGTLTGEKYLFNNGEPQKIT